MAGWRTRDGGGRGYGGGGGVLPPAPPAAKRKVPPEGRVLAARGRGARGGVPPPRCDVEARPGGSQGRACGLPEPGGSGGVLEGVEDRVEFAVGGLESEGVLADLLLKIVQGCGAVYVGECGCLGVAVGADVGS